MMIIEDTSYCYHFWYLYMIIELYLLLPVLKTWIKHSDSAEQEYFCIVIFLFSICIPLVCKLLGYNGDILGDAFVYYTGFIVYILAGYMFSTRQISKKTIGILALLTCIILIVNVLIIFFDNDNKELLTGYLGIGTFIISSLIFVLVKKICIFLYRIKHVIEFLSKYTLGIYIFHVPVLMALRKILAVDVSFASLIISLPIMTIIAFVISLLITIVVKKIPLISKLS